MKKLIAMLLVLAMVLSFAGCAKKDAGMSHADYVAAANDTEVVVETYVQAHQSWWDNKVTVYCQSPDGAYFLYELACSEEDAAKLVPGTKIRVTGCKPSVKHLCGSSLPSGAWERPRPSSAQRLCTVTGSKECRTLQCGTRVVPRRIVFCKASSLIQHRDGAFLFAPALLQAEVYYGRKNQGAARRY